MINRKRIVFFMSAICLLTFSLSSHLIMVSRVFGAGSVVTDLNRDTKTAGLRYFEKEGWSDLLKSNLLALRKDLKGEGFFTDNDGAISGSSNKTSDMAFEGVILFDFYSYGAESTSQEGIEKRIGILPNDSGPITVSSYFDASLNSKNSLDGVTEASHNQISILPQSEKMTDRGAADLVKHKDNGTLNTDSDGNGPPNHSTFGIIAWIRTTLTEAWQERRSPGQLSDQPFTIQTSAMGQGKIFFTPISDSLALHFNFDTDKEFDQDTFHSFRVGLTLSF